jgi:hypothetical protein
MPDNVSLLLSLRDEGLLVTTPSQDYDDTYTIEYEARAHCAIPTFTPLLLLPLPLTSTRSTPPDKSVSQYYCVLALPSHI